MVTRPARKAESTTPEKDVETVETTDIVADATPEETVEGGFTGRWFPVLCECGSSVLSDDEDERGSTITHGQHLTRLGAAAVAGEQTWTATDEDGTSRSSTVTPKDGRVVLTVEAFEALATAAGLSKVDPVA